jgi:hypothetical protein
VTPYSDEQTVFVAELWKSARLGNFTPEILLGSVSAELSPGKMQEIALRFEGEMTMPGYVFLIFPPNSKLSLAQTDTRIPGILTLHQVKNAAVAKKAVQQAPLDSGIDSFAFWLPKRRPQAHDIAIGIDPPLRSFEASQIVNGITRPVNTVNGWVPAVEDRHPRLRLCWAEPQRIQSIQITFDTDYDHPMETVLMTHPEYAIPSCVRHFTVMDGDGVVFADVREHHQSRWQLQLPEPRVTREIIVELLDTWGGLPAIYEVRCN